MAKIKEKLYEHRFGLFFFVFLFLYTLVFTGSIFEDVGNAKTYSMYAVDFSVGFCTRLLPGAIFNLLYDQLNVINVTVHHYTNLLFCIIGMSILGEVAIKKLDTGDKTKGVVLILMLFSAFSYSAVYAISVDLLDLHWYLSVVAFFFCLLNKRFYIFIPLTFWYAIMSHNACVLCYIPMFVLILIVKIIYEQDSKEKKFVGFILAISFFSSVALFVYMMLFETANLNFTMEEFDAFLQKRGVIDRNYYIFPFYRSVPEGLAWIIPEDVLSEADMIKANYDDGKFLAMIKTILQQIQLNLIVADHERSLPKCAVYLPAVLVCFINNIRTIRCESVPKYKKFIFSSSMLLFCFTVIFGLLFSTDTERWFGHATILLVITEIYMLLKDRVCREEYEKFFDSIPSGIFGLTVVTMITSVFL